MTFIEALNTPHTGLCAVLGIVVLWIREAYLRRQKARPPHDPAEFRRALNQHITRSQAEYDDRHR